MENDDKISNKKQQPRQKYQGLHRPFVTLAYAQTLDGMIATILPPNRIQNSNHNNKIHCAAQAGKTTSNLKLSSPQSIIMTHHLRSMHDAILVGGSTFSLDKPRLSARLLDLSIGNANNNNVKQPIPVVLDTHLNNLHKLLWDVSSLSTKDEEKQQLRKNLRVEISLDKILAHCPLICCSYDAAQSFLETLEGYTYLHQQQHQERSCNITIQYLLDESENKSHEDLYMPIRITIQTSAWSTKTFQSDGYHATTNDDQEYQSQPRSKSTTFTLLPCPIHKRTNSLDLHHLLRQLYSQFQIQSVMVEGGAGILSSFLNSCVSDARGEQEDDYNSNHDNEHNSSLVDCICITIAPTIIGGKWGLPAFGGLDVLFGNNDRSVIANGEKKDKKFTPETMMMAVSNGKFLSLGRDCIFLGRMGST